MNPWLAAYLADEDASAAGQGHFGNFGNFGNFGGTVATVPEVSGEGVGAWRAGLARLAERLPPAKVSPAAWERRIAHARRFCDRLGSQAEALGWSASALFALHPDAPLVRLDAMGVAFLGLEGEAFAISHDAVVILTNTGSRLTARRAPIPFPPAWETFT